DDATRVAGAVLVIVTFPLGVVGRLDHPGCPVPGIPAPSTTWQERYRTVGDQPSESTSRMRVGRIPPIRLAPQPTSSSRCQGGGTVAVCLFLHQFVRISRVSSRR
ncbi:MAG TPA: hypothetical protein VII19_09140, partial [Acidimicrobiales bacterium]